MVLLFVWYVIFEGLHHSGITASCEVYSIMMSVLLAGETATIRSSVEVSPQLSFVARGNKYVNTKNYFFMIRVWLWLKVKMY